MSGIFRQPPGGNVFPQQQAPRRSAGVLSKQLDITTAQMANMGSTPVQLVPGVPGFAILPIYLWIDMDVAIAWNQSAQPLMQWPGMSPPVWHSLFVLPTNNPGRIWCYASPNVFITISGSTSPYGRDLQLVYLGGAGADLTGGSFTRDTRMAVTYSLVQEP